MARNEETNWFFFHNKSLRLVLSFLRELFWDVSLVAPGQCEMEGEFMHGLVMQDRSKYSEIHEVKK